MIRDAQLQFSAAQTMPASTTSAASTNVVDLAITRGFNTTSPLLLYLIWTGTPAGTDLIISFVSATTATITSSPRYHWSSGKITAAASGYSAAGWASGAAPTLIAMPHSFFNPTLPGLGSASAPYLQYCGMIYASTGDNSAGILTCGLVQAADMRTYAASGYTAPSI